jgi:hypothetical protein
LSTLKHCLGCIFHSPHDGNADFDGIAEHIIHFLSELLSVMTFREMRLSEVRTAAAGDEEMTSFPFPPSFSFTSPLCPSFVWAAGLTLTQKEFTK